MGSRSATLTLAAMALLATAWASGQTPAPAAKPVYDAELARKVGADDRGMRKFVLVILKTGPTRVPAGKERDEMFKGHFANISRLADEGKLVLAGPLDGQEGWRGLFLFPVGDIEAAKQLVATVPVISKGEMVAEYHAFYGSAALMLIPDAHARIMK